MTGKPDSSPAEEDAAEDAVAEETAVELTEADDAAPDKAATDQRPGPVKAVLNWWRFCWWPLRALPVRRTGGCTGRTS